MKEVGLLRATSTVHQKVPQSDLPPLPFRRLRSLLSSFRRTLFLFRLLNPRRITQTTRMTDRGSAYFHAAQLPAPEHIQIAHPSRPLTARSSARDEDTADYVVSVIQGRGKRRR